MAGGTGGQPDTGPAGRQFGHYRLLDQPGDGAADEWLRAQDPVDGRDVVLHVLPVRESQDPLRRARFLREMPVVTRLTEPHLLPVLRYGETDRRLFVARPLVEGDHLSSVLASTGPLDPARAVDLVGQLARALDAAHAAGLVHGHVTSAGVLLTAPADGGHLAGSAAGEDGVLLADLGDAPTSGRGSVHAPPELTAGVLLDGRADVHALAGLLFELLTGHRPDPGPPQPPSALRPGLSAELDAVVLRGLAGDRDQRWTSPGGMAAAARAVLAAGGVEVARPADAPGPGPAAVGPAGRRRRTPGWAAAGGAVLAVLGAAALVHRRRLLRGLRRSRHLG